MKALFTINELFNISKPDDKLIFHGDVISNLLSKKENDDDYLYLDTSEMKDNGSEMLLPYMENRFLHINTPLITEENPEGSNMFKVFLSETKSIYIITHNNKISESIMFDIDNICLKNDGIHAYNSELFQEDENKQTDLLETMLNIKQNQCEVIDLNKTKSLLERSIESMLLVLYKFSKKASKGIQINNGLVYSKNQCPVCFEKNKIVFNFDCSHFLCNECISSLFTKLEDNRCPLCRKLIKLLFRSPNKLIV